MAEQAERPDGKPLSGVDRDALRTLDLPHDADRKALRTRYTQLVRRFHPDHNGGDRTHEKALQDVIAAYTHLRKAPPLRDNGQILKDSVRTERSRSPELSGGEAASLRSAWPFDFAQGERNGRLIMTDIPNTQPDMRSEVLMEAPDKIVSARELFGVAVDMAVPAFSEADERVPDLDPAYVFDPDTTLAILAGFAHNRRVMVQGYHGTGKSTHIEQVAARLNWPCIRINLDALSAGSIWSVATPSSSRTASRSPSSRRACCPGRCSTRSRSSSTNMMPAARTSCS